MWRRYNEWIGRIQPEEVGKPNGLITFIFFKKAEKYMLMLVLLPSLAFGQKYLKNFYY